MMLRALPAEAAAGLLTDNRRMAKTEGTVVNVNEVSRISPGTHIHGDISSEGDIRIDGTFEGHIYSTGRVVVGEKAVIKGDVVCVNADLWGKMEGDFFVKDTLSLKESSFIKGNLHIKRFQVDLGATFEGSCGMITEEEFDKFVAEKANFSVNSPAPEEE
jgi:cytoskeletal protein CcmA (bactofilin family)